MGRAGNYVGSWTPHFGNLYRRNVIHRQIRIGRLLMARPWTTLCRHLHVYVDRHVQSLHGPEGRERPGTVRETTLPKIDFTI